MHDISRTIAASPRIVWHSLAAPRTWCQWGPVIADVECADPVVGTGTRGRILVVPGVWLPFHVTSVTNGRVRSWKWRVAGGPEVDHRVAPHPTRRGQTLVTFSAPHWFPGHHVVTRLALWHLDAHLTRDH